MAKKMDQSKFMSEFSALLNESQHMKNTPKTKKHKRKQSDDDKENGFPKILGDYQQAKKKLIEVGVEHKQSREKLLEVMEHQMNKRKQISDELMSSLNNVIAQQDSESNVLFENIKKLEMFAGVTLKCIHQSIAATKSNIEALKEIQTNFQKESADLEAAHKVQTARLADQLDEDISKLKEKVVAETKQKQMENVRKSLLTAMQNNID